MSDNGKLEVSFGVMYQGCILALGDTAREEHEGYNIVTSMVQNVL